MKIIVGMLLVPTLLLLLAIPSQSQSSAQDVYYVKPTSDTQCDTTNTCRTLSEYVQEAEEYLAVSATMVFLPGEHTLDMNVIIMNVANFALIGDSNSGSSIRCTAPVSFTFSNISNLEIRSLTITSCGSEYNPLDTNFPGNPGAIVLESVELCEISDCMLQENSNTALDIYSSNITVTDSTFSNNSAPTSVEGVGVRSTDIVLSGGGISAFYSNLTATRCIFKGNTAIYGGGVNALDSDLILTDCIFDDNSGFVDGGGLSAFCSSLNLDNSNFASNTANKDGGGIVAHSSVLEFTRYIRFDNNLVQESGAGAHFYNCSMTFSGDSVFENNTSLLVGGGLSAIMSEVIIANSIFVYNFAAVGGGGLNVLTSTVSLTQSSIFIENQSNFGGGIAVINGKLYSNGTSLYLNNLGVYGGGMFMATSSSLTIAGNSQFVSNLATNGGGIFVSGGSVCYLEPKTNVSFVENFADERGGALHVDVPNPLVYCVSRTGFILENVDYDDCFFQIFDEDPQVEFSFTNNSAIEAGSDVYGGAVDRCTIAEFRQKDSGKVFDSIAVTEAGLSSISSNPLNVCPCEGNEVRCNVTTIDRRLHPGETFNVSVVATGQREGTVPAVIQSDFIFQTTATFGDFQNAQLTGRTCTNLGYTILTPKEEDKVHISLYVSGLCPSPFQIQFEILPCPNGFELSGEGACICEERLQTYTNSCNINNQAIERDGDFWVGFDVESQGLILHPHCPFDYCTSDTLAFTLNDTDQQCNYKRSDILCGSCQQGRSLVFGTSHCEQCSNSYLALLIPFAIAGFALVALLIVCRLTVAAGTINGLIFYANIIAPNRDIFFPSGETNILKIFLAWINLDLGIETCFYDGMDAYAKQWLQFVFPVYIWAIIGLIILASSYFPRVAKALGSNPVAVLATLFLLSYAKLLRTIIAAFHFATLEYPNGKAINVWLYDGNIPYLSGKHVALFVASLFVLLFLFLPYTLLLGTYQWLQVKSNWRVLKWVNSARIKSFMDAYHAPYKAKHRYWTGLTLFVRFILLLIFGLNALNDPSVNLLAICASSLGLQALTAVSGGIYKNWILQALEGFFILNLGILAASTYHVKLSGGNQAAVVYTMVGLAFAVFVGILLYHIYLQLNNTVNFKHVDCTKSVRKKIVKFDVKKTDDTELPDSQIEPTTSYVTLRELLLESDS